MADSKKALVIENDPTILEFIEVMFETQGFEVLSARDGPAALELSRTEVPDLVVSDLYMGGMNGLDLYAKVRADPRLRQVPFMFITADARDSVRAACLAAGADAFLLKPFTFDQFIETALALIDENR